MLSIVIVIILLLLLSFMFIYLHIFVQVTYQADQFLDKNKDYVVAEYQDLLNASACPFIVGLFPPLPEETSKSSKFSSIGARFKVYFLIRNSIWHFLWKNLEVRFIGVD
jgi:hypothetical protein